VKLKPVLLFDIFFTCPEFEKNYFSNYIK